ncbi:MAG: hypothetical protein ACYC5N_08710 [Endomicrobiales bacterium]
MQPGYDEIGIDDIIQVVKKRWKLMFFPGFIAAVIVVGIVKIQPETYEAYTLLKPGYVANQPLESIAAMRALMRSQPVLLEITRKVKGKQDPKLALELSETIKYEGLGELIRITALGETPEEAAMYTQTAADMIVERHKGLFDKAKNKFDEAVNYVNAKVRSTLVANAISEFRIEPTRVELPAESSDKPVKSRARVLALVTFSCMVLITGLLAFYYEGKEK